MSDETVVAIPDSFSSDGSTTSGGVPQREGGEAQAPQRSETQTAALAAVQSLRAEIARGKATPDQMARLNTLWRHGHGVDAAVPLELRPAPGAEDHRPHDATARGLEAAETTPATQAEREGYIAKFTLDGGHPEMAKEGAAICEALKLDAATTKTLMSVLGRHTAGQDGGVADAGIRPMDESQVGEVYDMACKQHGSAEKFESQSRLARAYLNSIGALPILEKHDWTRSSVAYDWRVLNVFAARAVAAGLKPL